MELPTRQPYPSDVSDEEWALVVPYLTLVREDAAQRKYELREVFNALRWMARFRRLARDYERLPETVAGLHFVAFSCLMLRQFVLTLASGP